MFVKHSRFGEEKESGMQPVNEDDLLCLANISNPTSVEEFMGFIYPKLTNSFASAHRKTMLSLRNKIVDEHNERATDQLYDK